MQDRTLRRGNASLAVLHAAQAAVILALSTDFSLPVTGAFMEGQPGSAPPKQDLLFELRIGPLVAAFLLLAALDHALVALPPFRERYERSLAAGVNPFRWLEYSLSASLMVVLIAMLTGIADYVDPHAEMVTVSFNCRFQNQRLPFALRLTKIVAKHERVFAH